MRKSKVLVPVVGHDVDDGHQAGHPADDQHHQAIVVGQVLHPPGEGGEVEHEVEALGNVSHGVSEADGDVKEDHFEDNEGREGLECSPLWEILEVTVEARAACSPARSAGSLVSIVETLGGFSQLELSAGRLEWWVGMVIWLHRAIITYN